MIRFPKKYKIQDLNNQAKDYKERTPLIENKNFTYSISYLPVSFKIPYENFYTIYLMFLKKISYTR